MSRDWNSINKGRVNKKDAAHSEENCGDPFASHSPQNGRSLTQERNADKVICIACFNTLFQRVISWKCVYSHSLRSRANALRQVDQVFTYWHLTP